jgi:hypothetical protein
VARRDIIALLPNYGKAGVSADTAIEQEVLMGFLADDFIDVLEKQTHGSNSGPKQKGLSEF